MLGMLCRLHEHMYESRKSRLSRETFDAMCKWRADLAMTFSTLWQSSRKDVRWTATGHLELGVLLGQTRARVIPSKYKHALMTELRNVAGQGVRTPRQLLVGLHLVHKRGNGLRLSLRQRPAFLGKGRGKSAAPSQMKVLSEQPKERLIGVSPWARQTRPSRSS